MLDIGEGVGNKKGITSSLFNFLVVQITRIPSVQHFRNQFKGSKFIKYQRVLVFFHPIYQRVFAVHNIASRDFVIDFLWSL